MKKNYYFNLIELMVVIAIFSLLFSMLQPSLKSLQNNSDQLVCQNQLKQIGHATIQYYEDFDGWLPISHAVGGLDPAWPIELSHYLELNFTNGSSMVADGTLIDCPSHNFDKFNLHPKYGGYAFNHEYLGWTNVPRLTENRPNLQRQKVSSITLPSSTVFISDGMDYDSSVILYPYMLKYIYTPHPSYPERVYTRHQGDFNVLWADFSVKHENWFDITQVKAGDSNWYFKKEK